MLNQRVLIDNTELSPCWDPAILPFFTQTCVMKHHPEVLMLLLKRFEFDYHWMTNVKINCPVDIACTLQIPEVREQYLYILSSHLFFFYLYPKVIFVLNGEQNQVYELYAVVDHFGDLRSGHYSASIKDENGWYEYDDRMVAPVRKIHLIY